MTNPTTQKRRPQLTKDEKAIKAQIGIRRFQPQHFPAGTIVRLCPTLTVRTHMGSDTVEVKSVSVDLCNALIETPLPSQVHDGHRTINVDWVIGIVKGGQGRLTFTKGGFGRLTKVERTEQLRGNFSGKHNEFPLQIPKSLRTHYVLFSKELLIEHLEDKYPSKDGWVDIVGMSNALLDQSFVQHVEDRFLTYGYASKKRVDKWFKANRNRFLINHKQFRKEREKEEHDDYDRMIAEEEFDLDNHYNEAGDTDKGSCYDVNEVRF